MARTFFQMQISQKQRATLAALARHGALAADPTYASGAGFGFNLNQPRMNPDGTWPNPQTVVASGSGIIIDFTNPGGSALQAQLSDGINLWCYDITNAASPVTIPWGSFNSACWDNSGTYFDPGTPIASLNFVLPSSPINTTFDVCVNGVGTI